MTKIQRKVTKAQGLACRRNSKLLNQITILKDALAFKDKQHDMFWDMHHKLVEKNRHTKRTEFMGYTDQIYNIMYDTLIDDRELAITYRARVLRELALMLITVEIRYDA